MNEFGWHESAKVGRPKPLGAQPDAKGCNFAIFSEHAQQVFLCLFDQADREVSRIQLRERTGSIWHIYLPTLTAGQRYGYRIVGPNDPKVGHFFNAHKLLLDPYAKALTDTLTWHRSLTFDEGQASVDSAGFVPKSVVTSDDFDWQELGFEGAKTTEVKACARSIYEVHVKGFTQQHPDIDQALRGKYLGLCSQPAIAYLKDLGVTTLQLLPCFSFMTEARLQQLNLVNYWGYNPVNFFAPDNRYAIDDPVVEFKTMVRELKRAGFEVILDVVYNHTAEGEVEQGSFCFKGIDSRVYYQPAGSLFEPKFDAYANHTGCGNTVNTAHPQVTQMVLDSLRYWRQEMGLDGFRFDLAPVLGRVGEEFNANHPLLSAMNFDPVLNSAVMIAEPWDIGPHGYQLGSFSGIWQEVNDKYRDCLRSFWRGDNTGVAELATRLMGSRDVFRKSHRPEYASVNHITYHDGFTLEDLSSYNDRHNSDNGEDNRDGHGHNLSCNFGAEGATDDGSILAQRNRHKRNLLASLILSRGTPHILAGDESGRTQQGNNNAYCQDNPISWHDWSELDHSLVDFTRQCLSVRAELASLNSLKMADEAFHYNAYEHTLNWLNEQGQPLTEAQWHSPEQGFLALKAQPTQKADGYLMVINNTDSGVDFLCPEAHAKILVSSADSQLSDGSLRVPNNSMVFVRI